MKLLFAKAILSPRLGFSLGRVSILNQNEVVEEADALKFWPTRFLRIFLIVH